MSSDSLEILDDFKLDEVVQLILERINYVFVLQIFVVLGSAHL